MKRPHHGAKGISLVEILVVVFLLALLAALLFPVANRIRASSDTAKCSSHLRQLATATQLFIQEMDGRFPSTSWYSETSNQLNPGITEYLGIMDRFDADSVMTCPAIQRGTYRSVTRYHRNYGINTFTTYPWDPDGSHRADAIEFAHRVEAPSELVLFSEGRPSTEITGAEGGSGWGYARAVREANADSVLYPHQGYQNVVFLDGHVRLVDREEFHQEGSRFTPFWGARR